MKLSASFDNRCVHPALGVLSELPPPSPTHLYLNQYFLLCSLFRLSDILARLSEQLARLSHNPAVIFISTLQAEFHKSGPDTSEPRTSRTPHASSTPGCSDRHDHLHGTKLRHRTNAAALGTQLIALYFLGGRHCEAAKVFGGG